MVLCPKIPCQVILAGQIQANNLAAQVCLAMHELANELVLATYTVLCQILAAIQTSHASMVNDQILAGFTLALIQTCPEPWRLNSNFCFYYNRDWVFLLLEQVWTGKEHHQVLALILSRRSYAWKFPLTLTLMYCLPQPVQSSPQDWVTF